MHQIGLGGGGGMFGGGDHGGKCGGCCGDDVLDAFRDRSRRPSECTACGGVAGSMVQQPVQSHPSPVSSEQEKEVLSMAQVSWRHGLVHASMRFAMAPRSPDARFMEINQ